MKDLLSRDRLRLATSCRFETRLRRSFAHTRPGHLAQDDGRVIATDNRQPTTDNEQRY